MLKEYSNNVLQIIQYINIFMPRKAFETYISEMFDSINPKNGINSISFNIYFNLPLFITEKIFKRITKFSKEMEISKREFIDFFSVLYYGSIEERAKLIFQILDFNNENKIYVEDIKLLLYHFHIIKNIYKDEIDLELINKMIFSFFEKDKSWLSYNEYIQKIKTESSDILFLFIILFFKFKPFILEELELFYLHNDSLLDMETKNNNNEILDLYPIISPSRNLFYYTKRYLGINNLNYIEIEGENEDDENILNELRNFEIDFLIAKNNLNIPSNMSSKKGRINTLIKHKNKLSIEESDLIGKSKTEKTEKCYSFKSKCEIGIRNKIEDLEVDDIPLEKCILYISGNNIYYYKNSLKSIILNKILEIEEVGNSVLICYIVDLKPKFLEINFSSTITKNKFVKILKNVSKYKVINDYYEINNDIGGGSFGQVFMGKERKTGKKVAIKAISKSYNKSIEDIYSVLWELSINKILKHLEVSYFVKIYHIFESISYVYIVMEFAGQDLASSLNNNWPSIDVIYDYMKQIANGISILNKFGIIHRDLKFQNIILSYENNDINDETDYEIKENLKLIDFGFSKILSYYEKTNEPYGTLCYLSPEIVHNEYYNNKEDIWTFGIIGYFFLTQTFPFFDNEYQNCSNTCKFNHIYQNFEEKDVTLDEDEFDSPKEKIIVKLVNMSLVKDIDKRASVNDILNTLNYHS